MEQLAVLDDAVPVHDDDLVGDRLRRLVSASDDARRERVGHRLCQPGEERHRQAGRSGRSGVGRPAQTDETKEGVEGEATGGVYQAAQRRMMSTFDDGGGLQMMCDDIVEVDRARVG